MHRPERAHQPGPRLTWGAHIAWRALRSSTPALLDLRHGGVRTRTGRECNTVCSLCRCDEARGRGGAPGLVGRPCLETSLCQGGARGRGCRGSRWRSLASYPAGQLSVHIPRATREKSCNGVVVMSSSCHPVLGAMVTVHTGARGIVVPEQPGASLALNALSVGRRPLAT